MSQDWEIGFTHMTTHIKLCYRLTLVDISMGWVLFSPTSRKTTDTVAQVLLEHTIFWFVMLPTIQTLSGPAFTTRVTELVSDALNIPYQPQPSGKDDRANGLTKQQLAKLSLALRFPTGLNLFTLLSRSPFLLSYQLQDQTPLLTRYFFLLWSLLC